MSAQNRNRYITVFCIMLAGVVLTYKVFHQTDERSIAADSVSSQNDSKLKNEKASKGSFQPSSRPSEELQ